MVVVPGPGRSRTPPESIPTASDDALIWWTPSVGPTAMLMAHRFATYAAEAPSNWSLVDLAQTFGAGKSTGRILHTFDRLERFGIIVRRERHRRDPALAPARSRPGSGPDCPSTSPTCTRT